MTDEQLETRRIDAYEDDDTPPTLYADEAVTMRMPTQTLVGHRGPIPARRDYGFYATREYRKQIGPDEYGFVMPTRVLKRVRGLGCTRILIGEQRSRMVFEFHESQFEGNLPKRYAPRRGETYASVPIDEHRGQWEGHTGDVLVVSDDE